MNLRVVYVTVASLTALILLRNQWSQSCVQRWPKADWKLSW